MKTYRIYTVMTKHKHFDIKAHNEDDAIDQLELEIKEMGDHYEYDVEEIYEYDDPERVNYVQYDGVA